MPETGDICQVTGHYVTLCEHSVLAKKFNVDDPFTPCPAGKEKVTWVLTTSPS